MNSSGIKRGLAFSAVTALAVVGLPLAANANTIDAAMDAAHGDREVTLYSQSSGIATVKNDGSNSTIRLQAGGTSDINTMRFEYSTDAGATWTHIALKSSRNDEGSFSHEWNPAGVAPGAIEIRAVGHSMIDGGDYTDTQTVTLETAAGAANAVSLEDGAEVGVYQSPITGDESIIVKGTASAGNTDVALVGADGLDDASVAGIAPYAPGKFQGILDISGSGYTYDAPDEVVLRAENGSDDVEGYDLYKQEITTVEAVPQGAAPVLPTDPIVVFVQVKDQKGNPMAGVQVNKVDPISGNQDLGLTNEFGQVGTTQTMNDGAVTYLANQTANDYVYSPELGDEKDELGLDLSHAAALVDVTANGDAFDRDEYSTGDIAVQVKDQFNADFDVPNTQDVTYRWKIQPFDPSVEPTTVAPASQTVEVVGGKFNLNLPTGEPDGVYELYASLGEGGTGHPVAETLVASYKVGEAAITFDGDNIAPAQTTVTVTGTLALADGTPLVGRNIDVHFDAGDEFDDDGNTGAADAVVVSSPTPVTDAAGEFEVKVEDLAESGFFVELDGEIHAQGLNHPTFDNWGAGGLTDFYHGIDFVTDQVPAGSVIDVEWNDSTPGPAGELETIDVDLEDAFGDQLRGVQVTLTLDKGYFTDGYEAPAAGNYEFTPTNLGNSITVATDSTGDLDVQATIGRDAGFDDDGRVEATVTATVDGISDSDTAEWNSDNPLGVSEISLVRTPGQAAGPTPEWNDVDYDLYAKDQFGNTVRGVQVDIDCAIVLGDDDNCPTGSWDSESDYDNGGDIELYAEEGTYTWTATADSNKYDADLNLGTDDVTATATEEFYEQVPTDFAIGVSPSGNIPVGDVALVTTTVLDQNGNPVEGLQVDFVRTGDPSEIRFDTNEDGEAVYAFNRTTAGVETVTAVVRTSGAGGSTVLKTLTTKVTFGAEAPSATLRGRSVKKVDVLVANGDKALAGNNARLFRINGYGANRKLVRLATTKVNRHGNTVFRVKDANGNKRVIRYQVVISNPGNPNVWTPVSKVK